MKNKYAAFFLALSLTSLTACGSFSETEPESTSSAETVYVMTTAQTLLQITNPETPAPTTTVTSTSTVSETRTQTTSHTGLKELPSTAVTTVSEIIAGTTILSHAETSTSHHSTSNRATSPVHTGTTMHATAARMASSSTTAPATTQTETETSTAPVKGETKLTNGIIVADYGTDHPRAIEQFTNNNKVSTRYAQTLEQFKASLSENVNVWCMVVPTSQAFYTPEDYQSPNSDQLAEYRNVTDHLDSVTGIPIFEALESHKDESIYSRTDYHWQPLAAYYAGEQFAAFAGVPYAPLDTYDAVTREGYVGAFSKVNKVSVLEDYPEEFTYYKPANLDQVECTYYNTAFSNAHSGSLFHEDNSINASYTVFVDTDECILETDTNVDNSRVLVIFKDRYGNALVPFLTQSFSKIYLCDFRYFDRNAIDFLDEVGATDVLFALSTVAVTTSGKVDQVANLMN
ncbi:MAG: hypothetical protein IJ906_01985 [Oscillospiraceae bacterium]|nr:hypothetical protein [Oscillospiraceae bacterium]